MTFTRLILFLERKATLKAVFFLMMAAIPFNAILFPLINDELINEAGSGRLEALFTYKPARLFAFLAGLGENGRHFYLISTAVVEFIYPLVYSLLLAFLLTIVLRIGFSSDSPLQYTQLFPFGMLVFHYISNTTLMILLAIYPSQPIPLAWIASAANTLKWCFGAFSLIALMIALARFLFQFIRQKPSQGASQ